MKSIVLLFPVARYTSCKEYIEIRHQLDLLNASDSALEEEATHLKWLETPDGFVSEI